MAAQGEGSRSSRRSPTTTHPALFNLLKQLADDMATLTSKLTTMEDKMVALPSPTPLDFHMENGQPYLTTQKKPPSKYNDNMATTRELLAALEARVYPPKENLEEKTSIEVPTSPRREYSSNPSSIIQIGRASCRERV